MTEPAPNRLRLKIWSRPFAAPRWGQSAKLYFSAEIVHGPGWVIFRLNGTGGWARPVVRKPDPTCGDYLPRIYPNAPPWVFVGGDCSFTTIITLTPTRPGVHSFTINAYQTTMVHGDEERWPPTYAFKRGVVYWSGTVR